MEVCQGTTAAALLCEAGDLFSWGFSVRADVCVQVQKAVAAGRGPKHQMGPK